MTSTDQLAEEAEDDLDKLATELSRVATGRTIYILDEELVVGNRSSKLVGGVIPVERGEINIVIDMDMEKLESRERKPYKISAEEKREFREEIFPYWRGKTVRDGKLRKWKGERLLLRPGPGSKKPDPRL